MLIGCWLLAVTVSDVLAFYPLRDRLHGKAGMALRDRLGNKRG